MTDQQPGSEPSGYGSGWSGYGSSPDSGFGYGAGPEQPDFYAPQTGYGQPGYGGYGYGFVPSDPQAKSSATVAFVINLVFCAICCGFLALPGAILGALAMSRADLEPESARNLTKWAWICLAILVGLYVIFGVVMLILGLTGNLDDSSSDY